MGATKTLSCVLLRILLRFTAVYRAYIRSFSFFFQVQEVAPEDFKDKEIFLGPVLTIECSPIEFLRPVIIQMPVSLGDQVNEGRDFPDKTRVRVLFRGSDAETEWTEITSDLEKPPRFDGSAVKFQVKHFSGYVLALFLKIWLFAIYHCMEETLTGTLIGAPP